MLFAVGAAGYAVTHAKKIQQAVKELVRNKEISENDANTLTVEIVKEVEKKKPASKSVKKAAKKPALSKKAPAKKPAIKKVTPKKAIKKAAVKKTAQKKSSKKK